jgi:hypothetical protein
MKLISLLSILLQIACSPPKTDVSFTVLYLEDNSYRIEFVNDSPNDVTVPDFALRFEDVLKDRHLKEKFLSLENGELVITLNEEVDSGEVSPQISDVEDSSTIKVRYKDITLEPNSKKVQVIKLPDSYDNKKVSSIKLIYEGEIYESKVGKD